VNVMNKFRLCIVPGVRLWFNRKYVRIRLYYYNQKDPRHDKEFHICNENEYILHTICESPAKAIMYLNHDDVHLREISKMIIKCNEPIEVEISRQGTN